MMKIDVFPSCSHHFQRSHRPGPYFVHALGTSQWPRPRCGRWDARKKGWRSAIQNTTVDCYKMRSNNSGISQLSQFSKHQVFNLWYETLLYDGGYKTRFFFCNLKSQCDQVIQPQCWWPCDGMRLCLRTEMNFLWKTGTRVSTHTIVRLLQEKRNYIGILRYNIY